MYQPKYTGQFDKDIKRLERSGRHDIEKLKAVIYKLLCGEELEQRHRDYKLAGNYEGQRECHIEPDWLMIYRVDRKAETITFVRTGSHADLFE